MLNISELKLLSLLLFFACSAQAAGNNEGDFTHELEEYDEDDRKVIETLPHLKALPVASLGAETLIRSRQEPKIKAIRPASKKTAAKLLLPAKEADPFQYEREDDNQEDEAIPLYETNFNNQAVGAGISKNSVATETYAANALSGFFIRFDAGYSTGKYNNPSWSNFPAFPSVIDSTLIGSYYPYTLTNAPNLVEGSFNLGGDKLTLINKNKNSVLSGAVGYQLSKKINLELSAAPLASSQIINSFNQSFFFTSPWSNGDTGDGVGEAYGATGTINNEYLTDANALILSANLYPLEYNHFRPFLNLGAGAIKVTETQKQFLSNPMSCNADSLTLTVSGCLPSTPDTGGAILEGWINNSISATKTLRAIQFGFGGEYQFNDRVSLEARYRYIKAFGATPLSNMKISYHLFTTGLIVNF